MIDYPTTIQTAEDFAVAHDLDRNRAERELAQWVEAGGAKVVRLLRASGNPEGKLYHLAREYGFAYDEVSGQVTPPPPYPNNAGWNWDPKALAWEPPVPRPDDPWTEYRWDEGGEDWVAVGESPQLQAARATARLSRLDFMLRLEEMGFYDQVAGAVAAESVSKRVRLMWENAATFERRNRDLLQMAEELGFTTEQLDAIFDVRGERTEAQA